MLAVFNRQYTMESDSCQARNWQIETPNAGLDSRFCV